MFGLGVSTVVLFALAWLIDPLGNTGAIWYGTIESSYLGLSPSGRRAPSVTEVIVRIRAPDGSRILRLPLTLGVGVSALRQGDTVRASVVRVSRDVGKVQSIQTSRGVSASGVPSPRSLLRRQQWLFASAIVSFAGLLFAVAFAVRGRWARRKAGR